MRSLKGKIGLVSIVVLAAVPILLWLIAEPLSYRFESPTMSFTSLGRLTAVIGMTLFSVGLILSARLSFLEEYFGGLDRMYNVHHQIGVIAFLLLAVHPLLLAVRYIPSSLADTASFLLPSTEDWPKNFGIIALLSLMAILSVTFYTRWRYQLLKFIHQLLGFVFFFGALHAFLIPSDLASNQVLFWYLVPLVALALLAYLYRTLFGRFVVSRYTYTVSSVRLLDPTVTEIALLPDGKHMHYAPGQFLFISFPGSGTLKETHPFSISSAPTEDRLRITVKALGDYTADLRNLQVGAVARIEGPFGSFSYLSAKNTSQVWIAGGIGITPFLNMARNLRVNPHTGHAIDFFYSTKTRAEMIFLAELISISEMYPKLRIIPFATEEQGFLTMDAVEKLSGPLTGKDIFVCGPPPMMHSLFTQCDQKGIPRERVHSEEFRLL